MVITHNNKPEIVNNLNDCLELINTTNPELATSIEYYHNNNNNNTLADDYKLLQQEFKSYEGTIESYFSCLNDVMQSAEELVNKINDAKRLNREDILSHLGNIIILFVMKYRKILRSL